MTNLSPFTQFGLPGIDRVPFGMHACHFYSNRDELIAALVPYFVAGLNGNERCIWVTAPPLSAREAIQALRAAWAGIDDAIQSGAIRILDAEQWYASSAGLKGLDVVQIWLDEEQLALADGYAGLRITGNITFLQSDDWSAFMEYEHAVTAHFKERRIVALCTYLLAQCDERQQDEVKHAHNCSLEHPGAQWRVIPREDWDYPPNPASPQVAPTGNEGKLLAYRCYFLGDDGKIVTAEVIECRSDAMALTEAERRLATREFSAIEVWDRARRVGIVRHPKSKSEPPHS